MLYIHTKKPEKCIVAVDAYFDHHKKTEWFSNPDVVRVIKEIDNTDVEKGQILVSPVFGYMSPDRLSGGCKAVILMIVQDEAVVRATGCGDNCGSLIVEISKDKDVHIWLQYIMEFPYEMEAIFPESGVHVHNRPEYVKEMVRLLRG